MKPISFPLVGLFALALILLIAGETIAAPAALAFSPDTQSPELFYKEALTVYYGNLQRRANGVPPLRWNRELTLSARWFAWDSVENRPGGYCGHQDTWGLWPSDRNTRYGYLGWGGAENAYCGMMEPQDAINGWMDSPGHRGNILDPNSQEIGMGYYRRDSDGRGYLVQDFGVDAVQPPLIISNELPSTANPQVSLYRYSPKTDGGLTSMDRAALMKVSNNPCFTGADWQPYQPEIDWTLSAGDGWKTVYSQIRDSLGRGSLASDTIYYGASIPTSEINFSQLDQNRATVKLYNLNAAQPGVQLSLGWMMNDSAFHLWWGKGDQIADPNSSGGTTYRLDLDPEGESFAWGTTTDFIYDVPMVAYFRMRASSNTSSDTVANIYAEANEEKQNLSIKGVDFTAPNQYQEFAIPFIFHKNDTKPFLIFGFSRTGSAVIDVDHVTVFTTTQPLSGSTYTWAIPGGHYRGQTVWVRYDNGSAVTGYQEAQITQPQLSAAPTQMRFLTLPGQDTFAFSLQVTSCGAWSVAEAPSWLKYTINGADLTAWASPADLTPGTYDGDVDLRSSDGAVILSVPVRLIVVDTLYRTFNPVVWQ